MRAKGTSSDRSCNNTRRQARFRRLMRCGSLVRVRCQRMLAGSIDPESLHRMLGDLDEFCSLAERLLGA